MPTPCKIIVGPTNMPSTCTSQCESCVELQPPQRAQPQVCWLACWLPLQAQLMHALPTSPQYVFAYINIHHISQTQVTHSRNYFNIHSQTVVTHSRQTMHIHAGYTTKCNTCEVPLSTGTGKFQRINNKHAGTRNLTKTTVSFPR